MTFKETLVPPTPDWLKNILESHFEELQLLWELREAALRDHEYLAEDLSALDQRIEAHVDGLILDGEHARPMLIEGLGGEERIVVFAAAYILLRLANQGAADQVMDALEQARDAALDGIRTALCHSDLSLVRDRLAKLLESGPPTTAAASAEAFASQGWLKRSAEIDHLLTDDDPAVRRIAWHVVSLLDAVVES